MRVRGGEGRRGAGRKESLGCSLPAWRWRRPCITQRCLRRGAAWTEERRVGSSRLAVWLLRCQPDLRATRDGLQLPVSRVTGKPCGGQVRVGPGVVLAACRAMTSGGQAGELSVLGAGPSGLWLFRPWL